ncbi:hypothetical protein ABK040_016748 [Willaertia magna]
MSKRYNSDLINSLVCNNNVNTIDKNLNATLYADNKHEFPIKKGFFKCNTYTPYFREVSHLYTTHTPFATCYIENICLDKKGRWILYKEKNSFFNEFFFNQLNNKPWVYTQGRVESSRGDFPIEIRDGVLFHNKSTNEVFVMNEKREIIEKLNISSTFNFIKTPTFSLLRYAAGNVGHIFTENMNQIISQMMNFNEITTNNYILFLEDIFDQSKPDAWIANYRMDLALTDKYSNEWFQLISDHPIQQLCHDEHGYKISNSPCRNKPISNDKLIENELAVCFDRFFVGRSISNLLFPWGRELMNPSFRELIWHKFNFSKKEKLFEKENVVVAFHDKPLSYGLGMVIWNIKEIHKKLIENLPKEDFMQELFTKYNKKLIIKNIELEKLSAHEQVIEFYNTDVYIVDHGSASYMSMVMCDESLVLVAPYCKFINNQKSCELNVGRVTSTFGNVQVTPYFHLVENPITSIDCNPRPLHSKWYNCDPILNVDVVYKAVTAHLRSKYRDLLS